MDTLEPTAVGGPDLVITGPVPRDRNPYWVYLDRLSAQTSRRTMKGCLDHIARMLGVDGDHPGALVPWATFRHSHTAKIRSELTNITRVDSDGNAQPLSASTINKHLSALRQVLRAAWRLGDMTTDEYERAADIENVEGNARSQAGRHIAEDEFTAVLGICLADRRLIGTRDAALLAALKSTGGRRDEIVKARRVDYAPGDRCLTVTGKRNKTRKLYLHPIAAECLGRWLVATEQVRGPLFCPIDRWGNVETRHMSADGMAKAVDRRRIEAGLPKLTTHDFRRTFIGGLLDDNVDIVRVQQLAGHASPATTARYDRRPDREKKAAVDGMTFPSMAELEAATQAVLPRPEDLQKETTDGRP
jgi:integrase